MRGDVLEPEWAWWIDLPGPPACSCLPDLADPCCEVHAQQI